MEDRTTIEISTPIRDRLRKMKDDNDQTYDGALDEMLSGFGYPDETPIDSEYRFTNSEYVFRCETDSPYPLCVNASPYAKKEAYLYESQTEPLNDLLNDFNSLLRYFGLYHDKRQRAGSFVIHQDGYNWFGLGFDNFLKNCSNQEERYADVPDIDPHHHEMATYVYHGGGATLLIYGQPNARFDKDYLKRGGISLLTHGCPTRRDFINLLEQVPFKMSNGLSWNPLTLDWWNGRSGYGPYGIPSTLEKLDPASGTPITDDREDIIGYVCENPYYGEPELLLDEFGYGDERDAIDESVDERALENLIEKSTTPEMVLLRSMAHRPNEDTYYEYERMTLGELPNMTGIGGGVTFNIKITPKGDYY
jgi:hypothetical protein